MTIGELARRTGMSHKSIRELEGLGLIYSAGRSEANYRLFGESALQCVQAIRTLRSLGLTVKEIRALAVRHDERRGEPIGPDLAALLERAEQRIEERLAELAATKRRIEDFRRQNGAALAGATEIALDLVEPQSHFCP